MIVKYTGPHTGGLQQVGTYPINIPHGQAVELPDEIAEALIEQAPGDWSEVKAKPNKKSEEDDES